MKKNIKHISIVLILFLFMVGVTSTVSATDRNMTPTQFLGNITAQTIHEGDNITLSGDTVTVNQKYTVSTNNIIVRANTTGTVLFKGGTNFAQFYITGKNVTLQGITFTDFHYSSSAAGAVAWQGDNGTLRDCNFTNNRIDGDNGGAIHWSGANGRVENSYFINNTANSNGGALYWANDDGCVIGSYFFNNTAKTYGGAIYWNSKRGYVENCIFSDNNATYGGAIFWGESYGIVENCKFGNNNASLGGAIAWEGDYSNVTNCKFINNSATTGGAISYDAKDCIIVNCNFTNNTAIGEAGAIYYTGNNIVVTNCTFTNNNASDEGSALYIYESAYSEINGCNFTLNKGLVVISGHGTSKKNIKMSSCNFYENQGSYVAIYLNQFNSIILDSCNFTNNNFSYATIDMDSSYNAYCSNCKFNNNTIYSTIICNGGINNTIESCNFSDDANITIIGMLYDSVIRDSTFANYRSMAIYLTGFAKDMDKNITLINNKFINSKSMQLINVYNNNTRNLSVVGGEGAIIYNEGESASILSPVTVLILGNDTKDVANGTTTKLYAQITVGSNSNYIIGENLFNFTVKGKPIISTLDGVNYTANYLVNGLSGDKVTVSGTCDLNASIEYLNGTLHIKNKTALNITIKDIVYGENLNVTVNVNSLATGNVTIYIDGRRINTTSLKNGVANFNIKGLAAGNYNLSATYSGDDKYMNSTNNTSVTVKKANPSFKIDNITYSDGVIIINSNSTINGNITVTIGEETKTVPIVNGSADLNITEWGLAVGDYVAKINFTGNANYTGVITEVNFSIEKSKTFIDITITEKDNSVLITLNLTDSRENPISGNVTISITSDNGYKHTETVYLINGTKSLELSNLSDGKYNVTAIYNATEDYESSFSNNSFVINNTGVEYYLNATNVVKYYLNDTQYHVTLTDQYGNPVAGKTILVTLNCSRWANKQYNITTNASGIATLKINLYAGFYTVTANFENATPITTNITVKDIFETQDLVKYYKNGTHFTVKVTDKAGNPAINNTVTLKVFSEKWSSSVTYTVKTNASGIAVLPINLLSGVYSISTTVEGITKYNNIAVLPTLTANNLVKKVSQAGSLTARLVDGQGNPVEGKDIKFTVKTKTYSFKTDSEGIATLPIHLGLGTWSFLISSDNVQTRATVKIVK